MRTRLAVIAGCVALTTAVAFVAAQQGGEPSGGAGRSPGAPPPKLDRSPDRLTLRVPAEQARKGRVFHVLSGRDAQVTFASEAPLERFEGTTNAIIGYVIVAHPEANPAGDTPVGQDPAADPSPLPIIHGEFHLAVDALRTGIPLRDRHLTGKSWLDAKAHPDIVFRLGNVENVTEDSARTSDVARRFIGDITGTMEIKGAARPLRVEGVRFALITESEASKAIAPGDLLRIDCAYTVNVRDYGVDHSILGRKVAEEIQIKQTLYLSTVAPEAPEAAATDGGAQD